MPLKPREIELDISLNCQFSRWRIAQPAEPEDFVLEVHAEIRGALDLTEDLPNSTPRDILLGKLIFYVIEVGRAVSQGHGFEFAFDAHQETMEAGFAIFDLANEEFQPCVEGMFPDADPAGNVLLLHRLTIHPLARGKRLGLAVLHRTIEDWSQGCSLVVMKPFPLQFEAEADRQPSWTDLKLKTFSQSERVAFGRLRNYYKRLGFRKVGRSEYFVLCANNVRPNVESLHVDNSISLPVASVNLLSSAPFSS